jgi:hypothetical protein
MNRPGGFAADSFKSDCAPPAFGAGRPFNNLIPLRSLTRTRCGLDL